MALDYELAEERPGTLPADFGDWDTGTPPDTLPPDFEGFDEAWGGHEEAAPVVSAERLLTAGSGSSAKAHEESDVEETDSDLLSASESGESLKRTAFIALAAILVLVAGVVLYYSLRPSSHRTTASAAHLPSEVYHRAVAAPTPIKVTAIDSSDELTLKNASGTPADTDGPFASAGAKSISLKISPNRSQSQPEVEAAKRHGKTE